MSTNQRPQRIVQVNATVANDGAVEVRAKTSLDAGEYDAVIVLIAHPPQAPETSFDEGLEAYMVRARRQYVRAAVQHVGGNRTKAAALLGVDVRTVYRMLAPEKP